MSNEDTALVPAGNTGLVTMGNAGTLALALMSDQEFNHRLAALEKGRDRIAIIQKKLMVEGVDYGTIPGTGKPTLYKSGAEKLGDFYGLRADPKAERVVGDGVIAPTISYQVTCYLHLGSLDGPIVAGGMGEANSWERKHRYRVAELACPRCGVMGTILKSKAKAEWFCWAKKGGCGATFPENDPAIKNQPRGQMDNPDPWDLANTILKMAEKRAFVDAILRATATSGLWTQDLEDMAPGGTPVPPIAPTNGNAKPTEAQRASVADAADRRAEAEHEEYAKEAQTRRAGAAQQDRQVPGQPPSDELDLRPAEPPAPPRETAAPSEGAGFSGEEIGVLNTVGIPTGTPVAFHLVAARRDIVKGRVLAWGPEAREKNGATLLKALQVRGGMDTPQAIALLCGLVAVSYGDVFKTEKVLAAAPSTIFEWLTNHAGLYKQLAADAQWLLDNWMVN